MLVCVLLERKVLNLGRLFCCFWFVLGDIVMGWRSRNGVIISHIGKQKYIPQIKNLCLVTGFTVNKYPTKSFCWTTIGMLDNQHQYAICR